MGDQLHDLSDGEEQMLSAPVQKMEQVAEAEEEDEELMMSAPKKKTRGLGSLFSFGKKKEAESMPQPKMKAKAPASKFIGKQSDSLATELYQMSNQAQMN